MADSGALDTIPAEALLARYPAETRLAVPGAIARDRCGWRRIGYELPLGRRRVSFAFVALKAKHVLLGFEYSAWMDDRDGLLPDPRRWATPQKGRFTKLRSVDDVPVDLLVALTREAARIATLPRSGRDALR